MNPGKVAVVSLAALAAGACGSDSGGDAERKSSAVTVVAENFAFDPSTVELDAGDTVTIELDNRDRTKHSFTIGSIDVDIEAEGGEAATVEVSPPSEPVEFYCRFHPEQMRGEIKVEGADEGGGPGDAPAGDEGDSPEEGGGGYGDY